MSRITQEQAIKAANEAMVCDLCGDQGSLLLKARCHLTAPLSVALDGNTLILRCYVPDCNREVARFEIRRTQPQEPTR